MLDEKATPYFLELKIVVYADQRQAGNDLVGKFVQYVRRQYPGAHVSVEGGKPHLSALVEGTPEPNKIKARLGFQATVYRTLDRLSWYIADMDAKYKIANRLVNESRKNYDGIKFAPTFFRSVTDALWLDAAISLARLFEKDRRAESVNIRWFLDFVGNHFDDLPQYPKPDYQGPEVMQVEALTRGQLEQHRRHLDELETDVVDRLILYRDRIGAHNDRRHFYDPSTIPTDKHLMAEDVANLVEEARSIFIQCWLAFMGTSTEMDFSTATDVERVLERLEMFRVFNEERARGLWKRVDPQPGEET